MRKSLTIKQQVAILRGRTDGKTIAELSEEYNVSEATIYRVLNKMQSEGQAVPRGQVSTRKGEKNLITLELTRNDTNQQLYRDFVTKDGQLPDGFEGWVQSMLDTLLDDEIKF